MATCGIIALENEVHFMDFYYPILSYGPICIICVGVFTIINSLIRILTLSINQLSANAIFNFMLILAIISILMQVAVITFSSELRSKILSEGFETGHAIQRLLKIIKLYPKTRENRSGDYK